MDLSDPGSTEMVIALAGPLAIAAYVGLILIPAWTSYGRWWERISAGFLSLFILVTLMAIGVGIGAALVWTYDQWA